MTQFGGPLLCAKWWSCTYTWTRAKNRTLKLKFRVHTLLAEIYADDSI
jgi:hypothetical protein